MDTHIYLILNELSDYQCSELIKFACKYSDSFGVSTFKIHKKKIKDTYISFFNDVEKFRLNEYEFILPQHYEKGQKFHVFNLNSDTMKYIKMTPNFFDWQLPKLPEDLTFYRSKKYWLSCISHERMIILNIFDNKVLDILKQLKIEIRPL